MGLTTCLMLGTLTIGGAAPALPDAHRLLQLDSEAVVIEGPVGVQLSFPARAATPEAPLDVVVTGLAAGVAPCELARERSTQAGTAWALVRHAELAAWDQVVVTWAQPAATGTPQGGFLARIARDDRNGTLSEGPLGGPSFASGGEINGSFITYKCPKTASSGCTVHIFTVNLKTGKLEEKEIELEPKQELTISAMLAATHYCTGCE